MKVSLSRLLETSKFLATEVGKQIPDFIQYVADLGENVIRALQNNLTFSDNFKCKTSTLSLKHNVPQPVNTDGKQVFGLIPMRAISTTTGVESFILYVNASGETVIQVAFVGAPTVVVDLVVVILFV